MARPRASISGRRLPLFFFAAASFYFGPPRASYFGGRRLPLFCPGRVSLYFLPPTAPPPVAFKIFSVDRRQSLASGRKPLFFPFRPPHPPLVPSALFPPASSAPCPLCSLSARLIRPSAPSAPFPSASSAPCPLCSPSVRLIRPLSPLLPFRPLHPPLVPSSFPSARLIRPLSPLLPFRPPLRSYPSPSGVSVFCSSLAQNGFPGLLFPNFGYGIMNCEFFFVTLHGYRHLFELW